MALIERIAEARDRSNILRHPFYTRWEQGELSREELQTYAGQYRHAVGAVRNRRHTAASPGDTHAAEEAAHVMLWDAWAASLGADRAAPAPRRQECVDAWSPDDALAATAVLYAVESAQPAIAETKLAGLRRALRLPARLARALVLPGARGARQGARRARAARSFASAPRRRRGPPRRTAEAALKANWTLLDGVERLNRG